MALPFKLGRLRLGRKNKTNNEASAKKSRLGLRGSLFLAFMAIAATSIVIAGGASFLLNELSGMNKVLTEQDVPRLTTVLTHHVIAGRLAPDQLPGEHRTLNGDTVTVAGPADAPTVAAEQTVTGSAPATLVCGGVATANATVYVIDQVLTPVG